MKRISSITVLALGLVGCAGPRYQIAVATIPSPNTDAGWVAVRVDQQTGKSWVTYNPHKLNVEWRLIAEPSGATQK